MQYINKSSQKVQQITQVSQLQYMDMNVDVPAEIQCQSTATHRHCRKPREAQQIPFPERSDQNIVKDAQMQKTGADDPEDAKRDPQKVQNTLVH